MRQFILKVIAVIAVLVFSPVGLQAMAAETSAILDEIRKSAHRNEPPRVSRRQNSLSQATMAGSSDC